MPDNRAILLIIVVVILILLIWRIVARRRAAEPRARFRRISADYLGDFLLPDGDGGEIHIEHALLCPRGIVIVNVKDVRGNVLCSDTMDEWAVLTGKNRFTLRNPQVGLYDRTAAVRRLVGEVPVEGHIAFTDSAAFTKGYPRDVIALSELLATLEQEYARQKSAPEEFSAAWEQLKAGATRVQEKDLGRV